jgi:uncharacterized protein YjbI with pentapeptide repeats
MYKLLNKTQKIIVAGCLLIDLVLPNCSGEAGGTSDADNALQDIKPGMDLRKVPLKGVVLHDKNLARVNLGKADLLSAVLKGSNLYKANLMEADLTGADLVGVNLYQADLRGAKLNSADLSVVDLKTADIFKADLSGAKCDDKTSLPPAYKCSDLQVVTAE